MWVKGFMKVRVLAKPMASLVREKFVFFDLYPHDFGSFGKYCPFNID
jgi:hypothetical protein